MFGETVRVLLCDDHAVVRQGLVFFLTTQPGIEIIGQAATGEEAVRLADANPPDVVIMDLVLAGAIDGVEATRQIKARHPDVEVLVLTSYVDEERVVAALAAGAAGYVMKDLNPADLIQAVRSAAAGEVCLAPAAARYLARRVRPTQQLEPGPEVLTDRESEVLILIARGLSNKEIAHELSITLKTVKAHISAVFQKLGVTSRTQAALYALRHNLTSLRPD